MPVNHRIWSPTSNWSAVASETNRPNRQKGEDKEDEEDQEHEEDEKNMDDIDLPCVDADIRAIHSRGQKQDYTGGVEQPDLTLSKSSFLSRLFYWLKQTQAYQVLH